MKYSHIICLINILIITGRSSFGLSMDDNQDLYFGLMIAGQVNREALSGIQAAVDEINKRDDLLSSYTLQYLLVQPEVE